MAQLAPLILICLYAGIVAAKPTVKVISRAASAKCQLDVLRAWEDQVLVIVEISGSDAFHKFEAGRSPTFYFQSENKTVTEVLPLLTPDGKCTIYHTSRVEVRCYKWKEDRYELRVIDRADPTFSKGTGYLKWAGGNDPDKKLYEFTFLEVQEANRKTGACMRREIEFSDYRTTTACDRVDNRRTLRIGLDSLTFYVTIRPAHNLSTFWAERNLAYYFNNYEPNEYYSGPIPLVQPGGTCKRNQKGTGEVEYELDCIESSPNVYNVRLDVLADKKYSLGYTYPEANRKHGWTILETFELLPLMIERECPAPRIQLLALSPTSSCGPDYNVMVHGKDRIWLDLVIDGTHTNFKFTAENGPRLYFATADGEESEPMPLITADGLCTTVTTHDLDFFACLKMSKVVYGMQVQRTADRKYSMGTFYIKWKSKGGDRKFDEYALPEVKDSCGDSAPSKGKATSGAIAGTRVNIGVVVLGLVVGVLSGFRT